MSKADLLQYFCTAEAISILLYPHAEVVIHDLQTKTIAAIYNNLSKRAVGDESLLEEMNDLSTLPDIFPLYMQTNWDGKNMRSMTTTLRDRKGKPIGLFCVNLDLSHLEMINNFLQEWLQVPVIQDKPEVLFKDDWRDKINTFVSRYLKEKKSILKALSKEEKQELVHALYREGAFRAKNAASYIADVLEISRATIYNYLRIKE